MDRASTWMLFVFTLLMGAICAIIVAALYAGSARLRGLRLSQYR